ncbi:MAG: bifunctional DNA primase/polymerase [Nitrososphaerota archaeon]
MSISSQAAEFIGKYLELGFSIIPVKPLDKSPAVKWKEYEYRKPSGEEVSKWMRLWRMGYNVGVICGEVSDLAVIDLDIYNNPAVKNLIDVEKLSRETFVVKTPSGGWHIYLRLRNKSYASFNVMSGGKALVEVRGNGRYVLAPPSVAVSKLTGKPEPYEPVSHSMKVMEVGDDLGELLLKKLKEKLGIDADVRVEADKLEQLRASLKGRPYRSASPPCIDHLLKGVEMGSRNEACIRLASFLLFFRRLSKEETLRALLFWNAANRPPLPSREVEQVLESVAKHGYVFGCHSMKVFHCDRRRCSVRPFKPIREEDWW